MLADIGEYLVDIHGQHEHQALLRQQRHIEYLDNFSGEEGLEVKEQVNAYYRRLNQLEAGLTELRLSEQERERRLDFLQFQSEEIDAANLVPGEDLSLAKEHDVLASAGELYDRASLAHALLHGEDHGTPGVIDRLAATLEELEPVLRIDDTLRDSKELLQTALAACEEASREIRVYRDGIDRDPRLLAETEARLAAIQGLKRKYGDTVDEILNYRQEIGDEITMLELSVRELAVIEKDIAKTRLDLGRVSEKLRSVRMHAAQKLRRRVSSELEELAMGSSVFEVDFREKEDPKGVPVGEKMLAVKADGVDTVEFLLSANPGEPPKPLARIASGGEISRIMLALKSILASVDEVGTLIFDEIDAGIGGRTGTVIGEKLAAIGKVRQVICVTHLPQIACMADVHYSIGKEVKDGRARTVATKLRDSDRVREIARMLGGHPELSATSMKHAKEMLKIG
jgi:DNA repair protein RecN (Recombination protein N)